VLAGEFWLRGSFCLGLITDGFDRLWISSWVFLEDRRKDILSLGERCHL
jgi:hypothetical protein